MFALLRSFRTYGRAALPVRPAALARAVARHQTTNEYQPYEQELIPQCSSCGIHLQKTDKGGVGFYAEPRIQAPVYNSKRLQYLSAMARVDEEGRKLLGGVSEGHVVSKEEDLVCLRCHNALHHNVYKYDEHQPLNYEQVVKPIPLNHQIVHVFSAYDFPLSLVPFKRRNVLYVMNKVDLLCGRQTETNFFSQMLHRLTGEKKLHVVSAHTSWSIPDLLKRLGNVNYLVGYVNTGKTRLANRLLNVASQIRAPGTRNKAPLGSSHLPALTRDNIIHKCGEKRVIDTPGFLDESVFPLIKDTELKSTIQGKKVLVNDLRRSHYHSVRGGQCLTVGGLFFVKPPPGSIVQAIPVCMGAVSVFSSLEKAVEVAKSPPASLKDKFLVNDGALDTLQRYVIPPFMGTVDLLIKDIGYVQLTPTGGKTTDEPFEVWAPAGVVLGVRETIEHFMTKYIKEEKVKGDKKVIRMKSKGVPEYKIFSRLYRVPDSCVNTLEEVRVQYKAHVDEFGSGAHGKRDETRNELWLEKL